VARVRNAKGMTGTAAANRSVKNIHADWTNGFCRAAPPALGSTAAAIVSPAPGWLRRMPMAVCASELLKPADTRRSRVALSHLSGSAS